MPKISKESPRLEHVRVNVSDFGRAVSRYEAILGLPAQATGLRTHRSTLTSRRVQGSS
jgi:hypothetical protein